MKGFDADPEARAFLVNKRERGLSRRLQSQVIDSLFCQESVRPAVRAQLLLHVSRLSHRATS